MKDGRQSFDQATLQALRLQPFGAWVVFNLTYIYIYYKNDNDSNNNIYNNNDGDNNNNSIYI